MKRLVLAAFTMVLVADPTIAEQTVLRGAEWTEPVIPAIIDVDLRDLPRVADWRPGDPIKEIPKRGGIPLERFTPPAERPNDLDPLLAIQARAPEGSVIDPVIDWAGQGFTGVNPPDTVGDVGPNYFIQSINGSGGSLFVVYDKTDGSVVAGPTAMESLGVGACTAGLGDPIVLYDEAADRWMMSEFSGAANRLCVYVSQTADPVAGGWFAYEFTTPSFPDYPKYGVWHDAYYVGSNESSRALYALDRAQMLAGAAATTQRFTIGSLAGFGFQAATPADHDGAGVATGPGIFMAHRDDEIHNAGSNDPTLDFLDIYEFSVDWVTPANSTVTGPTSVATSEFDSTLCGQFAFACFDQPGGGGDLDPLREVVMFRLQYRNFGTHETLVGNLVTDLDGNDHGGIRWFELRDTGGGWTLFQEGTYGPDAADRWMGAISMDADGNIAVGYNIVNEISGQEVFASLRYVGRASDDPLGTMTSGEGNIVAGSGTNGSNRYGDYSSMSIDPEDGCTLWFTGEYNPSGSWGTYISAFKFSTCTGGDAIFADGFESGDTTSWSSTVP